MRSVFDPHVCSFLREEGGPLIFPGGLPGQPWFSPAQRSSALMWGACDEGRKRLRLRLSGSRSLRIRCLKPPHHYPIGPAPRSILGLPSVSESGGSAAEWRIGCTSHSTVENRDGAADSGNIARLEIALRVGAQTYSFGNVCRRGTPDFLRLTFVVPPRAHDGVGGPQYNLSRSNMRSAGRHAETRRRA
jgi:hypothetical protein